MVHLFTCMARAMATLLPLNGFVMSLISWTHMPAIGLLVQVGTNRASVGKPPVFGMMPRIGWVASPAYLQPTSLENHAPLLLPEANTRFLSKQSCWASLSHRLT